MDSRITRALGLILLVDVLACHEAPLVDPGPAVEQVWRATSEATPAIIHAKRRPGGCGTLTDAEDPDVLRVLRSDSSVVLYANAQVGLAIVDVSDPDDPKLAAVSELTGTPLGVFEMNGAAVLVYAPWDRPAETVVRAVEIGPRRTGRTIDEVVLRGAPRDARRIGDVIVVTRDFAPDPTRPPMTAVTTFVLDERGLSKQDEQRLSGHGAVVGGSPYGVAVAREAEPELGADRTSVTWLGVSNDDLGLMRLHGTSTVAGVVPRWRRATDHVIDVAEDARVRLVACATSACPAGDAAAYAAIDFAEPDRPRLASWSLVARAGDGIYNFDGERLLVARPAADGSEATELALFDTARELTPAGAVRLRGTIGSVTVRRGGDVVALGWTGSASAGKRAIVHHVDARRAPKLAGSTTFGGDWTWSPAYDDDRAISFDPASTLAALPITTLRGKSGAVTAAQVLSLGPGRPRNVLEKEIAVADRLLFVDGRLLAFSSEGVSVVRQPGEHRPQRRWDDLDALVR